MPSSKWRFNIRQKGAKNMEGRIKVHRITKKKNEAPKEISGDYTVKIDKKNVVVKDNKTGISAKAKCHPDDDFNLEEGLKICLDRIKEKIDANKEIQIGDMVEIVSPGESYSQLKRGDTPFIPLHIAMRYRYGVSPDPKDVGTVVYIENNIYFIEMLSKPYLGYSYYNDLTCDNPIYAMNKRGIQKIETNTKHVF